jgi:predicted transcriptional regulator
MEKQKITVALPVDTARRLKSLAAMRGLKLQDVVEEAVAEYLKRQKT